MSDTAEPVSQPGPGSAMWSDNEADIDLLRFGYLAEEVAEVVTTSHLLPITVGIYADWGGGKSSLIRMVQKALDVREGVLTLQFNGWLFEDYEDAKTALMGSILDAIQEEVEGNKSISEKGRNLLDALMRRVNWMQVGKRALRYVGPALIGAPQMSLAYIAQDLSGAQEAARAGNLNVDEAQKLVKDDPGEKESVRRNIREFRHDFEDLLKEANISSLVVFIDDLDRCLPDTIIETLEAIKLFLFVPRTAFVIGADDRLIQHAVRQRFPELPGTEEEVGRDYLEKLIQVPIKIPPLTAADVETYMNLLFAQRRLPEETYTAICDDVAIFHPDNVSDLAFDFVRAQLLLPDAQVPGDLQKDFELTAQVVPVLYPGIAGNPRRAKRFLNTLLLRLSLGARRGLDLERRVLAKLMLLEYIRPEFFRTLASLQAAQGGRPEALATVEKRLTSGGSRAASEENGSIKEENSEPIDSRATEDRPPRLARRAQPEPRDAIGTPSAQPEDELPLDIQAWLADPWTRSWLTTEPALAEVDLGPYFFIAHEKVGALAATELRLSPAASDVLNKLLSSGSPTQEVGLGRAQTLSNPDAIALFEHLAQRIRQAEVLDARSPHSILFRLMERRPELLPQLVALYGSLPDTKIPVGTPPALIRVAQDTPASDAARGLLDRWTRAKNDRLRKAAEVALRRGPASAANR